MTEYEYIDTVNSSVDVMSGMIFDFTSVFFAFVICVYIVGSKISKVQAVAISLAYTVFLFFNVVGVYQTLHRLLGVAENYGDVSMTARLVTFEIAAPLLLVFIWLGSLIYLVTESRKGTDEKQDAT